jgi:hypothetical protein
MEFVPYRRYERKWRILLTLSHLFFILTFFTGVILDKYNQSFFPMFLMIVGLVIAAIHGIIELLARKHKFKN